MKLSTALYTIVSLYMASVVHADALRAGSRGVQKDRMLRMDERCTAAVTVANHGDGKPKKYSLGCMLPDGMFFPIPVTEEYIKTNMCSGQLIPGETELDTPGAYFDANGMLVFPNPPTLVNMPSSNHNHKLASITGDKTVLVVRVTVPLNSETPSAEELSNKMWDCSGKAAEVGLKQDVKLVSCRQKWNCLVLITSRNVSSQS